MNDFRYKNPPPFVDETMEKVKVVHLEDESSLRDILKQLVIYFAKDIELYQFDTNAKVMTFVRENTDIALFMLDIYVPGGQNGIELAEHLRTNGFKCPIVIVSAYTEPATSWLKQWNCQWFPKPLHVLDLRSKILPIARNFHAARQMMTEPSD
jgi:response regulator of citrate/malate metabolism